MNIEQVKDWIEVWKSFTQPFQLFLLIFLGVPAVFFLSRFARRITRKRYSAQFSILLQKGILYSGVILLAIMILQALGANLTPLLGAAGILGVALGFASQTSLSNVISGLFLISEKSFVLGDVLQVGSTIGTVVGVELLSVRIRTFDNKMVRIPNENLIKNEITNYTRYPIRRLDLEIGVAYKEDPARVQRILKDIAVKNPMILDEPEPVIVFNRFGDSALEFLFGVWLPSRDILKIKDSVMRDIKERFDAEGIEIPFPHRTIYAGSMTEPFPVRVVPAEAVD